MYYQDRKDAALQLIPLLSKYRNDKVVLLAVPRGGVPLAYYISRHYGFPVDLLMTKKIGHPANPEFAIGAVSPEDHIITYRHNVSEAYINEKIRSIRQNLKDRYLQFMGKATHASLEDRTVIIVDDGIATGNTVLSALPMLRKQGARKIIVAVPVSPPETARKIARLVDDFICPYLPDDFFGVGHHYQDFSEVTDQEVISLLRSVKDLKNTV